MSMNPINVYSGGGLRPAQDTDGTLTDTVNLAAGKTYPEGTVLGQVLGTDTAVNEVQTVTAAGTVSGGTYQLVVDGVPTTSLPYNAANSVVQAALEALPSVGVGGIVVGGGPLPTTPITLTFSGALGGQHQALVIVNSALTGTTPAYNVTLTTLGKSAKGYWDAYNDAASGATAGLAKAARILQYTTRVDAQGRYYGGSDLGADNNAYLRHASAFTAGTFLTSQLVGLDANAVADLGRLIAGDTATLTAPTTMLRIG